MAATRTSKPKRARTKKSDRPPDTKDETPKARAAASNGHLEFNDETLREATEALASTPVAVDEAAPDPGAEGGLLEDESVAELVDVVDGRIVSKADAPGTTGMPSGGGENIDDVATAITATALEGVAPAKALASQLPLAAARDVVMHLLPEGWQDESAVKLLTKLDDDDTALLLAWLSAHWWSGYAVGHELGRRGEDLRTPS